MVVEWALRYGADSRVPAATKTVSARVAALSASSDIKEHDDVISRANRVLSLPPSTHMPYSSGFSKRTGPLLNNEDSVSSYSFLQKATTVPDTPVPCTYSTIKDELMFPLGFRENMVTPASYSCGFPGCVQILPMQELISHFEHHLSFQHLGDPLRMVCPQCDKFHANSNDWCIECFTPSSRLVENLYGRYFPYSTKKGLHWESGTAYSGYSSFRSSGGPNPRLSLYKGSSSNSWNNSYDDRNNDPYGSSGSPGSNYSSGARSIVARSKRCLFSLPTVSRRLFRAFLRYRKYFVVLIVAATMSLILGYKEHNWIVSTIFELKNRASAVFPSKLFFIGVVLASIAFAFIRTKLRLKSYNRTTRGEWCWSFSDKALWVGDASPKH
jgi:hypothetical protein